jgi:hypothetical protein
MFRIRGWTLAVFLGIVVNGSYLVGQVACRPLSQIPIFGFSITTTASGTFCQISEPTVTQRMTEYRQVRFQPGDTVVVQAGGCVQTGGSGRTWKRYVDPTGPDSDRSYHGMIWIPGVTSSLVPISSLVGSKHVISRNISSSTNLFLRLGYLDDDYSDNGYYAHDDGTGQQCKGIGSAWVQVITIASTSGSPVGPPPELGPMDLWSDTLDANLLYSQPQWVWASRNDRAPDPWSLPGCELTQVSSQPHHL